MRARRREETYSPSRRRTGKKKGKGRGKKGKKDLPNPPTPITSEYLFEKGEGEERDRHQLSSTILWCYVATSMAKVERNRERRKGGFLSFS